jgi:hypothetical protein
MRLLLPIGLLLTCLPACAPAPVVPTIEAAGPPPSKAPERPMAAPIDEELPANSCLRIATRFSKGSYMIDELATDASGRLVEYAFTRGDRPGDRGNLDRQTLHWSPSGCLERVVEVTEGSVHIEEEIVYRCGSHGEVLAAERKSTLLGATSYTWEWQGTFGPPKIRRPVNPTDHRHPAPSTLPMNLGARWWDSRNPPFSFQGRVIIRERDGRDREFEGFVAFDADGLQTSYRAPRLKAEGLVRYDDAHHLVGIETPSEGTSSRSTWKDGRVIATEWIRPEYRARLDYHYDARGRLVSASSEGGSEGYELRYDEACQILRAR